MPQRSSIGLLMGVIGVVAVDLSAVDASARVPDMIIAVYICGPILVAVQLALFLSVLGRPARRPFRLGFAASGVVSAAALFWACLCSPFDGAISDAYTSFWDAIERVAPALERVLSSHEWSINGVYALYYFVPQLLMALAVGASVDRLTRAGGRCGRHGTAEAAG